MDLITPLRVCFPILFEICDNKNCSVAECARGEWSFGFRRNWLGVIITNEPDEVSWGLSSSKTFTSQSLYKFLTHGCVSNRFAMKIWKCRVPLKIRIFLWQLLHDRIQTAQQLKARQWKGSTLQVMQRSRRCGSSVLLLSPRGVCLGLY
jgi:hypothetical protein